MNDRPYFDRRRLPPVADVLTRLGLHSTKSNNVGYVQACCPIHGESHASLSIHIERGNWRCFACGATGGDVLELYRRTRGLSFVEAAKALGAWQ